MGDELLVTKHAPFRVADYLREHLSLWAQQQCPIRATLNQLIGAGDPRL
jgi:hypothetical protein